MCMQCQDIFIEFTPSSILESIKSAAYLAIIANTLFTSDQMKNWHSPVKHS